MADSFRSVDDEDRFVAELDMGRGDEGVGLTVEGWCEGKAYRGRFILYIRD